MTAKARMIKLCARTDDTLLVDSREVAGVDRSSLVFVSIVLEVVVITEDVVVVDDVVDETVCCTFPTLIERL
jgi:hypothetical protein